MSEQTLFIVKPDGVQRKLIGEIISRFEKKGFTILKLKMFTFTKELATEFYSVHKDKPFFGELLEYITSGPVVVTVVEGNNAVATTRQMVGATKSFEAEPGSIRGDFGLGFTENIIHASDSTESFDKEVNVVFKWFTLRIRQPIVAVLGHVDSGKTSLLDKIRGTGVQGREAGGITQHICASFLPDETIQKLCGALYEKLGKTENKVPGILVIDTPGHEVFTNLRARGGSAADIAILVVDINRGFQPQTNESLKILESRKVPFVVALNKVDMISGWQQTDDAYISQAIKKQSPSIQTNIDEQIYNVVGALSILGYQSEAFYRVQDFKKEISTKSIQKTS